MSFLKITNPAKRDAIVREFLKTKENIKAQSQSSVINDITSQRELASFFKPLVELQRDAVPQIVERPVNIHAPQQRAISYERAPVQEFGAISSNRFLESLKHQRDHDTTFGVYRKDNEWFIGNKPIKIHGDDLIIDGTEYLGTRGLWELIGSNNPTDYTDDDYENYADILRKTNAMKRNNDPNSKYPKSNKGDKWIKIVKPIWSNKNYEGSGAVFLSPDPDALVKRLELVRASYQAGNTGVTNEITSILDELLRLKVITRSQYNKLNVL